MGVAPRKPVAFRQERGERAESDWASTGCSTAIPRYEPEKYYGRWENHNYFPSPTDRSHHGGGGGGGGKACACHLRRRSEGEGVLSLGRGACFLFGSGVFEEDPKPRSWPKNDPSLERIKARRTSSHQVMWVTGSPFMVHESVSNSFSDLDLMNLCWKWREAFSGCGNIQ